MEVSGNFGAAAATTNALTESELLALGAAVAWDLVPTRGYYLALKRALDIVVALALLMVLLPVMLLCALAVRLESPGPILFRQQRAGQAGRLFTLLKYRSMYDNCDPGLHREYATAFVRGTAEVQSDGKTHVYKLTDDPRVTRVGRWLRRTSLDELPQLLNVLHGTMSLVGPRPPIPYELEAYQPVHWQRLSVKPGITGIWQVYGRSVSTFDEMVQMDLQYIREQSLLLDLKLLIKTFPIVLGGRGAH
jgi:lipopolysaccharide/colanic/teichoic acid biosynthesis glycosyltransferase